MQTCICVKHSPAASGTLRSAVPLAFRRQGQKPTELTSLSLLIPATSEQRRQHVCERETLTEKRRAFILPHCGSLSTPASNPTVISHTDLFVCRDSCSFLSPPLSLLFNFSYLMRRSRVRGGVETRSGG